MTSNGSLDAGEPCLDNRSGGGITRERIRLLAMAALTVVLVGLTVWLAIPFLPGITWAVALAILAWPMHRWVAHRVASRGVAAAISTTIVAAAIVATGVFVSYQVARGTVDTAEQVKGDATTAEGIREKAESVPVVGRAVAWLQRVGVDVETAARGFLEANLGNAPQLAQGSIMAFVQFLVAMFILYYLFRDRDRFLSTLRDLAPLSSDESNFLMTRAANSVHATLYATVVTSIIDATAFGLAFWWAGLEDPVLWAVIMFILSLLPVLGAGLIWVPATVYLAMSGRWPAAVGIIAVGVVTATYVDNILYARLAGDRMRMHNVPVLISFLGGLAVFGVSGMILGPATLAATEALLEVWKRRMAPPGARAPLAAPDPRARVESVN